MKTLLTFLILCVGAFWIYDGIHRGIVFSALLDKRPSMLVISSVSNLGGRVIFPDYVAWGTVKEANAMAMVHIFQDQFLRLEAGSTLEVYPLKNRGRSSGSTAQSWKNQSP